MKKQVAIAMGLAVISTGALASKARLEALGQDANGSMYLDDARNVMLNPAHLNDHKDFVTFEWGDNAQTNATTDPDETASPKAEGGMFKASGSMVYGLYFGSESNTSNALRAAAMGANTVQETNNTDFFVAGDAGVQWGARLTYHSIEDEAAETESSATRLTVGVISGDTEGYLNFGVGNKAEDKANSVSFDGKSSIDLGVTHNAGDLDYMIRYQSINAENEAGDEYTVQNTRIGAARNYKLNDKAQAWAAAWYNMDTSEDFTEAETKSTYLPIVIGVEVMAKDWLTLRGSVSHELMGTDEDDNGDKASRIDTTKVAAGASLVWGDLTLDGMIGNTDNDTTVTDSTAGGNGTVRTDTLMSRVSMTYKF